MADERPAGSPEADRNEGLGSGYVPRRGEDHLESRERANRRCGGQSA
jgi:hypothetical protein